MVSPTGLEQNLLTSEWKADALEADGILSADTRYL
jgi:hypothetical protein